MFLYWIGLLNTRLFHHTPFSSSQETGLSDADVKEKHCLASWVSAGVGVTKPISSVPLISRLLNIVKTLFAYWISCVDRCCRSLGAVTPVKYECDANNLTGNFARPKILLAEKLTNGALVTPTPGEASQYMCSVQKDTPWRCSCDTLGWDNELFFASSVHCVEKALITYSFTGYFQNITVTFLQITQERHP